MSAGGQFEIGPDPRRHRGGRPPGAVGIAALIRRKIMPHADEIMDRTVTAARAGDPEALAAVCGLLEAIARPHRPDPTP